MDVYEKAKKFNEMVNAFVVNETNTGMDDWYVLAERNWNELHITIGPFCCESLYKHSTRTVIFLWLNTQAEPLREMVRSTWEMALYVTFRLGHQKVGYITDDDRWKSEVELYLV